MQEERVDELIRIAIDMGKKYIPAIVGVIVLLIIANSFSKWAGRATVRSLQKSEFDATLTRFFGNMVRQIIMILALLACLGVFGVETTSFAALIGAGGLAVGLAFQGSLSNFAAGVMLLIFRPFKVDDVVTAAGITGKIVEIGLFSTQVNTPDNRRFILPNGAIFGSTIENITFHPVRRIDVAVGVDYSADIDRTREVLTAALDQVEGKLDDPAPAVVLTELGASSVDWVVRCWANTPDFFAVKESTTRAVKYALDQAGIGIPYPQMDVHLDGALNTHKPENN
jgi:small conductance mechanosensitive channel